MNSIRLLYAGFAAYVSAIAAARCRLRFLSNPVNAALGPGRRRVFVGEEICNAFFWRKVAFRGGNELNGRALIEDCCFHGVNIEDINRACAAAERALERIQQLLHHRSLEWIEHVDDEGRARPWEFGRVRSNDFDRMAGAGCPRPDGEILASPTGKARIHLDANHPRERIERCDHDCSAETRADVYECPVPDWECPILDRRISGRELLPELDRDCDHRRGASVIRSVVKIVSVAGGQLAAFNVSGGMNAVPRIERVRRQALRAQHLQGAHTVVTHAAKETAILK